MRQKYEYYIPFIWNIWQIAWIISHLVSIYFVKENVSLTLKINIFRVEFFRIHRDNKPSTKTPELIPRSPV